MLSVGDSLPLCALCVLCGCCRIRNLTPEGRAPGRGQACVKTSPSAEHGPHLVGQAFLPAGAMVAEWQTGMSAPPNSLLGGACHEEVCVRPSCRVRVERSACHRGGHVRGIGTHLSARGIEVALMRRGRSIATARIPGLDAPLDLSPRMATVTFNGCSRP